MTRHFSPAASSGPGLQSKSGLGQSPERNCVPSIEARRDTLPTTMKCRECDGAGEAEYMALDETRYVWRRCHVCEGSGTEKPYCLRCDEPLTVDLFCVSCDEWPPIAETVLGLPNGWNRVSL